MPTPGACDTAQLALFFFSWEKAPAVTSSEWLQHKCPAIVGALWGILRGTFFLGIYDAASVPETSLIKIYLLAAQVRALTALQRSPYVVKYKSAWVEPNWDRLSERLAKSRPWAEPGPSAASRSSKSFLHVQSSPRGPAVAAAVAAAAAASDLSTASDTSYEDAGSDDSDLSPKISSTPQLPATGTGTSPFAAAAAALPRDTPKAHSMQVPPPPPSPPPPFAPPLSPPSSA